MDLQGRRVNQETPVKLDQLVFKDQLASQDHKDNKVLPVNQDLTEPQANQVLQEPQGLQDH